MAMRVGKIMLSFFVSSWMIIHFGKNPTSGGRPPSDSIISRMEEVIKGVLFHDCDNDRVVVDDVCINNMKVVAVMIIYRTRFRSVMVGL